MAIGRGLISREMPRLTRGLPTHFMPHRAGLDQIPTNLIPQLSLLARHCRLRECFPLILFTRFSRLLCISEIFHLDTVHLQARFRVLLAVGSSSLALGDLGRDPPFPSSHISKDNIRSRGFFGTLIAKESFVSLHIFPSIFIFRSVPAIGPRLRLRSFMGCLFSTLRRQDPPFLSLSPPRTRVFRVSRLVIHEPDYARFSSASFFDPCQLLSGRPLGRHLGSLCLHVRPLLHGAVNFL